jgi:hypothetical protein
MKVKLYFLFFLILPTFVFSQGSNLQFNQVLNLKNGDTYTVPTGKVVKVESIYSDYHNLSVVYNYIGCDQVSGTRCYYKLNNTSYSVHPGLPNNPFAMYQIGDLIARLSVNGQGFNYVNDTLYTMYSGIYCGSQNPYNACSPAVNVGLNPERGVIDDRNLPIWLKEGKQIAISALVPENYYNPPNLTQPYVRGSGTFITAIEFNIVP